MLIPQAREKHLGLFRLVDRFGFGPRRFAKAVLSLAEGLRMTL